MDDRPRIPVELSGVPETLLWTLYYRAQEAERPDAVLHDPLAVELVGRIDYPFEERLGRGGRRGQWQGLRARTFDDTIIRYLTAHPAGTVVTLGEGLETQFWRVDNGQVRWLGVDLPESASLRKQVLPEHERHQQLTASALDDTWMDAVDPAGPVLITAQGLLMYLPRTDVHALLARCGQRFPGAQFVFDGVPRWTSAVTQKQLKQPDGRLPPPPMPWSMDHREAAALRSLPGIGSVERLHPPRGRGALYSFVLPAVERIPGLRSQVLSIWSARLG